MKNAKAITVLVATVTLFSFSAFSAELEPLTVSPGATERITGVEVRCPTFSWQAVPGAVGYEVVVYQLPSETELSTWSLDQAVEVLFVELPVGVTAWTPSLESGLTRGAEHVWFVRGVFEAEAEDATGWSVARFFRVAGGGALADEMVGARGGVAVSGAGSGSTEARSMGTRAEGGRSVMAKRVGEKNTKDVSTAMAAIRGEMPDVSGETYGVVGTSNSVDGAGLGAVNSAGGPDLVLDGAGDGETDLLVSQSGVQRSSSAIETFAFTNPGVGELDVNVEGWVFSQQFVGGGAQLTGVDAETLDGIDSAGFSPLAHLHDDRYFTEGELSTSGGGGTVHWDNLATVPSGFADGVDHDTTYSAGTGVDLIGTVFSAKGTGFGNVVVVAKSGGDFTSIQAAIDSITDASDNNPYLVWVGPGVYTEPVATKSHVHLHGAGLSATVITSAASSSTWPPDQATLIVVADVDVRELTVLNNGTGLYNTGIVAEDGPWSMVRVAASATGSGSNNYGIVTDSWGSMESVESIAEGAAGDNFGLAVESGRLTVHGGDFYGGGGVTVRGISNHSNWWLTAINVTARADLGLVGADGSGLFNEGNARLIHGSYRGVNGSDPRGITNNGTLEAKDAQVSASYGTATNWALDNTGGSSASAVLDGGVFEVPYGGGDTECIGIYNHGDYTSLEATAVTVRSTYCETVIGLHNETGSEATLYGGVFHGYNGIDAYGIKNTAAVLHATDIEARGEGSATDGIGLYDTGRTELTGGRFVGEDGSSAYGVFHDGPAGTLYATLTISGAILSGEDSYGLRQDEGIVMVGYTGLDGGVLRNGGTLNCFYNHDETFSSYTCP